MSYNQGYQHYQESQVLTASKGKLLLMTYDGAIRFVRQAQLHMTQNAFEEKNTSIIKAQRLILELIYTLNPDVDPDFAHRLSLIYDYMFNRLVEANVSDDPSALKEVETKLMELRTAWAEADRQLSQTGAVSAPRGNGQEIYAGAR